MLDAFRIKNLGETIGFVARVVPFASPDDDAHVVVFPWVSDIRQIFIRAVEINIVVVIPVEK